VCVVLLGVACVWASADEETVTNDFVSSEGIVHPRMVQNLAVLSVRPEELVRARTVPHLSHHDADEESGVRFADADPAAPVPIGSATKSAGPATPSDAPGPAGPPRPPGVSIDASTPTPPPPPAPKPKPADKKNGPAPAPAPAPAPKPKDEPQRYAMGYLDGGPVQRHGDKPDAILDFVKDIQAVPEKDGLPDATLKTTKAVGTAKCGKGCQRKFPVVVGIGGLNERPAHKTGRRVSLPGDKQRVREQHEALKVPSKYTWRQRDLDTALAHLRRSHKRIQKLRRNRKRVGDAPLAVPVVI